MALKVPSKQRDQILIAQEAARLIVNEGLNDYLVAKTKAAERLNLLGSRLPRNDEIEVAANEYHRIYGSSEQLSQIKQLRQIAFEAMVFFKSFSPRVVGGVVDGTAGQYNVIKLHLHCATIEEILIKLVNSSIPFIQKTHILSLPRQKSVEFPEIGFVVDKVQLALLIYPLHFVLNPPFGKAMVRMDIEAMKQLMNNADAE